MNTQQPAERGQISIQEKIYYNRLLYKYFHDPLHSWLLRVYLYGYWISDIGYVYSL